LHAAGADVQLLLCCAGEDAAGDGPPAEGVDADLLRLMHGEYADEEDEDEDESFSAGGRGVAAAAQWQTVWLYHA
jgi:hypothetical protein